MIIRACLIGVLLRQCFSLPIDPDLDQLLTGTSINLIIEARNSLSLFVKDLTSFVDDMEFRHQEFTPRTRKLHTRLFDIQESVHKVKPPQKPLLNMLNFAKHMFSFMKKADKDLRWFDGNTTAQLLTRCVLQLNVALLALLSEAPESTFGNSMNLENALKYSTSLIRWKNTFSTLENVPYSVRIEFDKQIAEAEDSLRILSEILN